MEELLSQHVVHNTDTTPEVVIITGLSGAGKSTVLRALEDLGFFCVDNLPIDLLPHFFKNEPRKHGYYQRVALGIDIRAGLQIDELVAKIMQAKQLGIPVKVFFLATSSQVLIKRFQETRRKHPLGNDIPIDELIVKEKQLLQPLNAIADVVVETDQCTPHQLRTIVRTYFQKEKEPALMVHLISFGFKYGVPAQCNFVYDIRSLPNPYFVEHLKPLDGTDPLLQAYLFEQPEVQEYWQKLVDFIDYSIDRAYKEGRYFMTIAIGCTGGRHRSVAFVQELSKRTKDKVLFFVKHRDIHREQLRQK